MTTLADLRRRPFDVDANAAAPVFAHVRVPGGTVQVGVSREDAAPFLGSNLFSGGVTVMSLSGWEGREKRPIEPAEVMAVIHHVFGPETLRHLRTARMGGGAVYVLGLVSEDGFCSPTPLQDAALSRQLDCAPLVPAGQPQGSS